MKYIVLLGRIFYSVLFILGSLHHFNATTVQYAVNQGVPMASFLVPFSGVIGLLGGLSILVGYKARWGAWLIVIFLVPITIMMHRFWGNLDPLIANLQEVMFMKNLALLGAALLIAYFGSGPMSLSKKSR
jgi:putative oxidoreductase